MHTNLSRPTKIVVTALSYLIFLIVLLLVIYPLFWMVLNSLKPNSQIFSNPYGLPHPLTFQNYVNAWGIGHFSTFFWNSILVTVPSVAGIVFISALAGYAFARFEFKGSQFLFVFLLIGVMVPPQAIMISSFRMVSRLNLINTYLALIFTYFSWAPFGIYILTTFFRTIPGEIEDAAKIDGASPWQLFWLIALPLAQPALATIAIFYFVWVWNDFLYPLLYLQQEKMYTIPLGLTLFRGRHFADWAMINAALSIGISVPLITYLLFQNRFIKGLTSGAIKG